MSPCDYRLKEYLNYIKENKLNINVIKHVKLSKGNVINFPENYEIEKIE